MSRIDDWVERSFVPAVGRLSERTISIVLLLIYVGGGLAVPLVLDVPKLWIFVINSVAVLVAALLGMFWIAGQIRGYKHRLLLEWTTNLRHLNSEEFEWLVGELFRREGWTVKHHGRQDAPDGNIDLELQRDGARTIVQCKRWTAFQVGVDELRKFAGTLMREGLPASAGIFVTLSDYTQAAREEASTLGLSLIERDELHSRMERHRRPEPCPTCGARMLLDHSIRGWWFRCVSAGCGGKRDLGSDPVRAVEFLTEGP